MNVVLTVAESKRLIGKGIAAHPAVREAMKKGYVVVCKGTTNSYVAEELLGKGIKKTDYVTGCTMPAKRGGPAGVSPALPDIVLKDGEPVEGVTQTGIVDKLGAGDVYIKGANALNYDRKQAALLIGHGTGGTIGAAIGVLTARSVRLLIPIGLEKSIPGEFHEVAEFVAESKRDGEAGPAFWTLDGEIFTEIEAIEMLTGAEAIAIGAGGIGGAEGAVRLLVSGTPEQMDKAMKLIEDVQGEPMFVE